MKRGFTLIELVAVIVVLGIIGLITYPVVTSILNDSKEKAYNSQVLLIVDAAKRWGVYNSDSITERCKVDVQTLIQEGYLDAKDDGIIKDPRTDTIMGGCVIITYNETYNQYLYEYDINCSF